MYALQGRFWILDRLEGTVLGYKLAHSVEYLGRESQTDVWIKGCVADDECGQEQAGILDITSDGEDWVCSMCQMNSNRSSFTFSTVRHDHFFTMMLCNI